MSKPPPHPNFDLLGGKDLEALWRAISTSSLDGFWVNALDGTILHVNDAYCRMSGYTHDELLRMTIADLEAVESLEDIRAHSHKILEQGYDRFETRHRTKGGHLIDLEVSLRVVPEYEVIVAFLRDITGHKKAINDLLAAQNRYSNLVETAQDIVWSCDLSGQFTYLNPAVETILGFRPEELLGGSFEDITPADCLEADRLVFEKFLTEGRELVNHETCRLTRDGKRVDVLVNARLIRDSSGSITGIQGTAKDITERKCTEEELRRGEAYQRQIIAKAPFGAHFYTLTKDGQLVFEGANPAASAMLAIDDRQLVGKPILEAFPGLAGTPIPEIYTRLAREGGEYHQDQVDYDEGVICGAFEIFAFQTVPGHMVVFFSDITERKRSELELVRAREEALQASRAKDDFLSVVSHELRTPLTPILGFAEMLTLQCENPEHREYLGHISEAGQRMLRLVEDILNFSRLNSNPPNLQPGPFFPDSFFRRELKRAAHLAKGNRLELLAPEGEVLSSPPEGVALVADQKLLAQILHNLIGNACKFTDHGVVSLRYGVAFDEFKQATLVFEVEDTGVGIPAEYLAMIWEPFSQVDSSTQRVFEGAGLGLAICRTLATHLGGTIEVESTPGVGSRFRVAIPVETQTVASVEEGLAETDRPPRLSQAPRILVVEDNDMNRLTFETQLRLMGGTVMPAVDAEEALDLVRIHGSGAFDLILMDLHLPGMEGLELCAQLQKLYGKEALPPMIAISADASERSRQECSRYGIQRFIEKPVSLTSLHAALETCLGTLPPQSR